VEPRGVHANVVLGTLSQVPVACGPWSRWTPGRDTGIEQSVPVALARAGGIDTRRNLAEEPAVDASACRDRARSREDFGGRVQRSACPPGFGRDHDANPLAGGRGEAARARAGVRASSRPPRRLVGVRVAGAGEQRRSLRVVVPHSVPQGRFRPLTTRNRAKKNLAVSSGFLRADGRTRTGNPLITRPLRRFAAVSSCGMKSLQTALPPIRHDRSVPPRAGFRTQ
jgi:hypothetical protein